MNKVFIMHGSSVEPSAEVLLIPEFKKIWEKDSSTSKAKARAAFAYIYHIADPNSLYANANDREDQVKEDFLEGKAPTADIKKALEKYTQLITTPEQRLLEGSLNAADKLAAYFSTIDFSLKDDKGNLVHDPHKVMTSLKSVSSVMRSLKELRELMDKGQEEREGNRGNARLNMFDEE